VEGDVVGSVGKGLLVLLGIGHDDAPADCTIMADKIAGLRCFEDADSKFNLALEDVGGSILAISQFTLFGDCRKGRRPSFIDAARPEHAVPLYEAVIARWRERGITVETGSFGAHMDVQLVNDGPVTLMIDTKKNF
jgi:D-tyrosyl-tRNA(Tyr) deacylase